MLERITWFRQSALRWVDDERTVYIDPWGTPEDAPAADLILITHAHLDHFQPEEIERLRGPGTKLVAPRDVADELMEADAASPARVVVQDGLSVTGDPAMLRLLLQNLIANALKFSSRRAVPMIQIGLAGQTGDQQTFFVRDNGEGFDMRFAERLFGLFQRLHGADEFPGSGIGLATARRIVRRHGGEMWARGKVGHGACFYFSLPGA